MHHYRMLPFRKMSCEVSDVINTPRPIHRADFKGLFEKYGLRKAELLVSGLLELIEELSLLRDGSDFRKISELDIQKSLKDIFGAEWQWVLNLLLEKNSGSLVNFIEVWNERVDLINTLGLAGFLSLEFEKEMMSSLKYINDIWLGSAIHPRKGTYFDLKMVEALGGIGDYIFFLLLRDPIVSYINIFGIINEKQQKVL